MAGILKILNPWGEKKTTRTLPDPRIFPHLIQNSQQVWLRWYEWWPRAVAAKDVKGVLFVVSGLGEHGMRYDGFAEEVAEELGLAVFSLDHQGHGLSEGERKYVERFSDYVDDYMQFLVTVLARYGPANKHGVDITQLPRFMLGHSMGGLIALHTARKCANGIPVDVRTLALTNAGMRDADTSAFLVPYTDGDQPTAGQLMFNGVVLSGPAIMPDPNVATPLMKFLSRSLSSVVPHLRVKDLPPSGMCSNPQVLEQKKGDALFPFIPMNVRWADEMIKAMDMVTSEESAVGGLFLNFPLLIMHGGKDIYTNPDGSRTFYKAAEQHNKAFKTQAILPTDSSSSAENIKFIVFEGKLHEILNETNLSEVRSEVYSFIRRRMGAKPNDVKPYKKAKE